MNDKPQVVIAPKLNKISEVIDIDGNKLSGIKGEIIEKKKVFNMADLGKDEPLMIEAPKSSLSDKIEKKINDKINELLDKKIDDIFSKMF